MKILKALLKVLGTLLSIILILYGALYLFLNSGNLNFIKKNMVKQTALNYITNTYPNFKVHRISVKHEWKSNIYVVTYGNEFGDEREISFDHTGKELFIDSYIDDNSRRIIYDYTESIHDKLESELNEKVVPIHYISVELYKNDEERKKIVLEGMDISNNAVNCSIGINYQGELTKIQFAEIILKSIELINKENFKIKELEFTSQNSLNSRYNLIWEDTMSNMSPEKLAEHIKG